jgi:uncharacterized membrane protein
MSAPSVGDCVSAGFEGFRKNPGHHVLCTLLFLVVTGMGFGLLNGPMLVGYMRMNAKEMAGEPVTVGDLFRGFDDFVPALLAVLLGSIAVAVGFLFCIIPGLLLTPIVAVAAWIVAEGEKDGIVALQRAWALLRQYFLPIFLCNLVLSIIGGLGVLLCYVGLLLTLPISMIGLTKMGMQLTSEAAPSPALPQV